jgi:hypothetical protein
MLYIPLYVPSIVLTLAPVLLPPMLFTVTRDIDVVVPVVAHKVDRAAASIIFSAVLAPFFFMSGGHMQVHRFLYNVMRCRLNHNGPWKYESWLRKIPDIEAAIKTRLANTDRNTNISGLC